MAEIPTLPEIVERAWAACGDGRRVTGFEETSPGVSTNRVFRLDLEDHTRVFCKLSSYGSYVHFRQDHALVMEWHRALADTRFAHMLALPLRRDGLLFSHREGRTWLVFYEEARRAGVLPRALPVYMVEKLGTEMAALHRDTAVHARHVCNSWTAAGADIATLFDRMTDDEWSAARDFGSRERDMVAEQCERFLSEATRLGYHEMQKMPVLVDWNRGNFSVRHTEQGPELYSRWDYDWLRIEPRTFDFYFFARVVRAEGDQTGFSYSVDPLLEPRFVRFLQHYHRVNPLAPEELLFLRECFRFFLLVYVLLRGEHFFVPALHERLRTETLHGALRQIDQTDFSVLVREVLD